MCIHCVSYVLNTCECDKRVEVLCFHLLFVCVSYVLNTCECDKREEVLCSIFCLYTLSHTYLIPVSVTSERRFCVPVQCSIYCLYVSDTYLIPPSVTIGRWFHDQLSVPCSLLFVHFVSKNARSPTFYFLNNFTHLIYELLPVTTLPSEV